MYRYSKSCPEGRHGEFVGAGGVLIRRASEEGRREDIAVDSARGALLRGSIATAGELIRPSFQPFNIFGVRGVLVGGHVEHAIAGDSLMVTNAATISRGRGPNEGRDEDVESAGMRSSARSVIDEKSLLLPRNTTDNLGGDAGALADGRRGRRRVVGVVADREGIPSRSNRAGADATTVGALRGDGGGTGLGCREAGSRLVPLRTGNGDGLCRGRSGGRRLDMTAAASELAVGLSSKVRSGAGGGLLVGA